MPQNRGPMEEVPRPALLEKEPGPAMPQNRRPMEEVPRPALLEEVPGPALLLEAPVPALLEEVPALLGPMEEVPRPALLEEVPVPVQLEEAPVPSLLLPQTRVPLEEVPRPALPLPQTRGPIEEAPVPALLGPMKEVPRPALPEEASLPVLLESIKKVPRPALLGPMEEESRPALLKEAPVPALLEPIEEVPRPVLLGPMEEKPRPALLEPIEEVPRPALSQTKEPIEEARDPALLGPMEEKPRPALLEPIEEVPRPSLALSQTKEPIEEAREPALLGPMEEKPRPALLAEASVPALLETMEEAPVPALLEPMEEDPRPTLLEEATVPALLEPIEEVPRPALPLPHTKEPIEEARESALLEPKHLEELSRPALLLPQTRRPMEEEPRPAQVGPIESVSKLALLCSMEEEFRPALLGSQTKRFVEEAHRLALMGPRLMKEAPRHALFGTQTSRAMDEMEAMRPVLLGPMPIVKMSRPALLQPQTRKPKEEVPGPAVMLPVTKRPMPSSSLLLPLTKRHMEEVSRAALLGIGPMAVVPRSALLLPLTKHPMEEESRPALLLPQIRETEVPRPALMKSLSTAIGTSIPTLLVALVLLGTLMPCMGLERLFADSEITVPRRLLPKGDKSTDSQLYAITFWGEKHFIYLEKQRFIPADFKMYINGQPDDSPVYLNRLKADCYYQGYVLDSPNSAATLRTCTGLRGLVEFANVSYVIEPFRFLQGFKHLLHRLQTRHKEDFLFTDSDTNPQSNRTVPEPMPLNTYLATPVGQTTRFMEIAIFVTKDLFDSFGASTSTVINDMMQLVSYLNTRFSPLDIRIFMSSLDIWTDSDQVELSNGTTSEKLDRFMYWIEWTWPKPKNYDIPLLLLYDSKMDRGFIYFGKMCAQKNGALIVYPPEQGIEKFSSLVAHMLGHNIGLMHDDNRDCQCSGTACIMNTNIANVFGTATLSSCSVADFGKFLSTFGATCLLNEPIFWEPFNPRICGNGIIDDGEACDCGTPVQCLTDPCCDSTCKFKGNAKCAWGACCKDCQIHPYGTLCGAETDECDFPEFCDGISPVCPVDVFQQNGNECNDHKWYCYTGKCQNPDARCKELFGEASQRADASCFVRANVQKDRFGNCGFSNKGSYSGCSVEDAMCGKLQCTYSKKTSAKAPIIYYSSNSSQCTSIDFLLTSKIPDPAFVSDGTKCDHGKLCLQQKCVHLSVLEITCSASKTCNGHGLCNNKGKCQCFAGWAPPTCTHKETGGNLDFDEHMVRFQQASYEYHLSLTIGLCIAIPLLIIIIVLIIKRDAINRCCTRRADVDESDMEDQSSISPTGSVTSV